MSRRDAHLSIDDRTRERPAFERHFPALERAAAERHDVIGGLAPLLFGAPPQLPPDYLRAFHVDVADALDVARTPAQHRVIVKRVLEEVLRALAPARAAFLPPDGVVDFIWRMVDDMLRTQFHASLADAAIIDPFAGVGLFADRLIRNHGVVGIDSYEPSRLAARAAAHVIARALADTGRTGKARLRVADALTVRLPAAGGIRVIASAPPWSGPEYLDAYSWAAEQLGERGVVAYLTPRSLVGSLGSGMFREALDRFFDQVRLIDLRGQQRRSGERRRIEGGNVFGAGSTGGTSVVLLARGVKRMPPLVHRIGEGLSREEKLAYLDGVRTLADLSWETV